jgi:hypothetical protein
LPSRPETLATPSSFSIDLFSRATDSALFIVHGVAGPGAVRHSLESQARPAKLLTYPNR